MPLPANFRGLLGTKLRRLTDDESRVLLTCGLAGHEGGDAEAKLADALKGVFVYEVLRKRLDAYRIPVKPSLIVQLATYCRNPAHSVLWAYTLCVIWQQTGFRAQPIDGMLWAINFAEGIPIDKEYERVWDLQKMTSEEIKATNGGILDNWLDNFNTWPLPPAKKEDSK